jgi:cysteine synthase
VQYLKEQNPNIRIGMADPMGAAMYNYYSNGVLESSGTSVWPLLALLGCFFCNSEQLEG